jgi:menaquinol-cytochrome c reductase cytochrome b/c subunit
MATAVVARPVARPQSRARDEEVLVWPDLVFVEFISALLFTFTIFILSVILNAPLLDQANPDVTQNPAKAPWYLLNLQELLLHMDGAMAGVVVPTVWLIILGAFPYFDRDNEGQGAWFATEGAIKLTVVSAIVGVVGTWLLILWNSGELAGVLNNWFGLSGGDTFRFLENSRSIQGQLPWPAWSESITYLPFELKILDEGYTGLGPTSFQHLDLPAFLVEIGIPMAIIVGLPTLLVWVLWRIGWVFTRRDALIVLFSGFVAANAILTLVGTGFRGENQDLVFPWNLSVDEGIPGSHPPDH